MKSELGRLIPRTNGGGAIVYLVQKGEQTSVVGSMFSGKSERAINEAKRAVYSRRNVQVFKPTIDNRYDAKKVNSHDKDSFSAQLIDKDCPEEILYRLNGMTSDVVIDEVQFFSSEIEKVCRELVDQGINVWCAGLDTDFRGEPFGPVPVLMAKSENVVKLHGVCDVCGDKATRTQRLINGKPAHYTDPIILVGAKDSYGCRCSQCHEVPGRPA